MDQDQNHGSGGSSCPGSHVNDDDSNKKKAKTSATITSSSSAPSSTSSSSHDYHASLPPRHVLVRLHSLPDIAHDAIASYLTNHDMHCMMECDQWLLKAYGGRIKRLRMPSVHGDDHSTLASAIMLSLLGRRPGLLQVTIFVDNRVEVLIEAMRKGYLNQLLRLKVKEVMDEEDKAASIAALCDALGDGLCPKINALEVTSHGSNRKLLSPVGRAMRSRMEEDKGCCGLKSLELLSYEMHDLTILSSGACEALEELKVEAYPMLPVAAIDLSEWLLRTKAPNLRALKLFQVPNDVVAALCSPGVAPRLQTLDVPVNDATSISFLSQAIARRGWLDLLDIKLKVWQVVDEHDQPDGAANENARRMVPALVEALGQGAPRLKVLSSDYSEYMFGPEGGMALARMLGDGGCPRLEELHLRGSNVDDGAMVELARALEGGAPCSTTLRRLDLQDNGIGGAGVRALMEAMEGGVLPHLEYLNLNGNRLIKDHGVVALAMAMTTRRVLSCLQMLDLRYVGMTDIGAWALFQSFRHHKPCPRLKTLRIGRNPDVADVGMVRLAKAIEAGAFQHLQELNVEDVGMTGEGFRALVNAMVAQHPNPGCPRLEVLHVKHNDLGDEGMAYLAEAIKVKGTMQYLRQIQLTSTDVGDVGAMALLDALIQSHVCPNLQRLSMTTDDFQFGQSEVTADVRALQQAVMAMRRKLIIEIDY